MLFKEIDESNYRECLRLEVNENQVGFVSHNNALVLAKAYVYRKSAHPFAIYDNGRMIGFIQYRDMNELGNYLIDKIMIDKEYQGKGFGKQAMEVMIEKLKGESKYKNSVCVLIKKMK